MKTPTDKSDHSGIHGITSKLVMPEDDPIIETLGREEGVPWVWVCGGALATILVMILSLFGIISAQGLVALWPKDILEVRQAESSYIGVPYRTVDTVTEPDQKVTERVLLYLANRDFGGNEFEFADPTALTTAAADLWYVERLEWGPFIGRIKEFVSVKDGVEERVAADVATVKSQLALAAARSADIRRIESKYIRPLNSKLEHLRLEKRSELRRYLDSKDELAKGRVSEIDAKIVALTAEYDKTAEELRAKIEADGTFRIVLEDIKGQTKELPASQVVRALQPNSMGLVGKLRVFISRVWEFLSEEPREANTAGGVLPAIFGTVTMTLLMTLAVMPLGVLTAVYMREISKQGLLVSFVRIAVGNLAGVPSIVYGIFGLGFFCYTLGASIDSVFFVDKLPNPTFGTGGILWASLTLALLTVPVVIVATEEALSAVPRTLREASYGCGATRLQTLRRVILPKAAPGIMTGLILAMARGAGEVAPLLMTGVVKLAPTLPIDGNFPYVHLERSFMHLGFHIYDLGFQSRSTEVSRPMVFASTLLLIALVLTLNFFAIKLRSMLRKRFEGRGAF